MLHISLSWSLKSQDFFFFLKVPAVDLWMYAETVLQKDSVHIIVLTRGLLAKGKEHSSLSFQSKTSLDIFITLNSLKHLIGMWQEKKQSELADQFSYGKSLLGSRFYSLQW